MSFISDYLNRKKFKFRRRPFTIEEDKLKEEVSIPLQGDDRFCRICFDDKKKEIPIQACRCKVCFPYNKFIYNSRVKNKSPWFFQGTIGLVHMACLEKWLAMSNTRSCELCGYNYQTVRTPKYTVIYSIYYWIFIDKNPQYHRGLKSDFIVFTVLTPIAFIGVYSCIIAADFYSKEPHKYSPASRWTTISLLVMVVLLTFAYYLWVAVTIRFHMRIWYMWWQSNNIVKVTPRDPNSDSSTRITEATSASSFSRISNRRMISDTSVNNIAEVETQLNEYSA